MELTVVKCTESSNGGFVVTMNGESNDSLFGQKLTTKFYAKLATKVEVGTKQEVAIEKFNVISRESVLNEGTPEEATITMKWLSAK